METEKETINDRIKKWVVDKLDDIIVEALKNSNINVPVVEMVGYGIVRIGRTFK